jgi:hypothetical protein
MVSATAIRVCVCVRARVRVRVRVCVLGALTSWYLPQQYAGVVSTTKAVHETMISARMRQKKR